MPKLSDFVIAPGPATPPAGVTINIQNLLQVFPDGYMYPCIVSDYATVPNIGTAILAATAITSASPVLNWINGTTFKGCVNSTTVQDINGNLYIATHASGTSTGLKISKYNSLGGFLWAVNVDTSANYSSCVNLMLLTSGNLAITYYSNSVGCKYAILTAQGKIAYPSTLLNGSINAQPVVSIALSGGGFAACYNIASNNQQISFYSNSGTLTNAAMQAVNDAGASMTLAQLPSGNVVMAVGVSSFLQYIVYTPTAGIAVPLTSSGILWPVSSTPTNISVLPSGYFCLSAIPGTSSPASAAVFSAAGALQGSVLTSSGAVGSGVPLRLVNDGTNFWMVVSDGGSTNAPIYHQITQAGVMTLNYGQPFGAAGYSAYNMSYDGAQNLYIMAGDGGTNTRYTVFNLNQGAEIVSAAAIAAGASAAAYNHMVPLGDGVFMSYVQSASTSSSFAIWKAFNTSIIGPSQVSASPGSPVKMNIGNGFFTTTPLRGSASKPFTHKTTANIYGNSGALVSGGISLQGM
jgi:hypothetical protein